MKKIIILLITIIGGSYSTGANLKSLTEQRDFHLEQARRHTAEAAILDKQIAQIEEEMVLARMGKVDQGPTPQSDLNKPPSSSSSSFAARMLKRSAKAEAEKLTQEKAEDLAKKSSQRTRDYPNEKYPSLGSIFTKEFIEDYVSIYNSRRKVFHKLLSAKLPGVAIDNIYEMLNGDKIVFKSMLRSSACLKNKLLVDEVYRKAFLEVFPDLRSQVDEVLVERAIEQIRRITRYGYVTKLGMNYWPDIDLNSGRRTFIHPEYGNAVEVDSHTGREFIATHRDRINQR